MTPADGLSWADVVDRWRGDGAFRRAFAAALAATPTPAFAWETVPVSATTRDRRYEQVTIDVHALARVTADAATFRAHWRSCDDSVVVFENLGRDATLVVPRPLSPDVSFPHLAAFLRTAAAEQIDALWRAVGTAVHAHWQRTDATVWVSTAGLGVHWLHVRLDSRPKYYRHAAFRTV